MDDNTIHTSSSCSAPSLSHSHSHSHQSQISWLFGEQLEEKEMPFSSYYPTHSSGLAGRRGGGESGGGAGGGSIDYGRRREDLETDFDSHDYESEEGGEVPEEPAKMPAPFVRSSGSKRSRAAEVHNLSEKRRRSRINEKMKALQNLIPNSNKTDKASMLDEAIEYLKQLQLQVQMLSMRNGLNVHPMYLPEALHPLQASQMCMGFGVENGSAMHDIGVAGMLPLNQDPSARNNSFDLPSRCTPSHESIILPTVTSITASQTSFRMESSQPHRGSFQLPVASAEMLRGDMVPQQQVDSGRIARNLSENELAMATSLHFSGQASSLEHSNHLEACMLGNERSEKVLHKDQTDSNHHIFSQHLDGLQAGRSYVGSDGDVKTESQQF